MRCPYCGCMSDGCGFCSDEGWQEREIKEIPEDKELQEEIESTESE